MSGKVTDSLNKPLSDVSLMLKRNNIILAFKSSDDKGFFTIILPPGISLDSLILEASILSYDKQVVNLHKNQLFYEFHLKENANQLATINVKNIRPVLKVRGDTISYKTSDFSNNNDRVIGDVLRRMPGISVDKEGKIAFNGKSISNLYIDGDDLLDDKYNIATKSIPNGIVNQVEVLQNHQPVKMLKDKVVSDKVAINLKISDGAKLRLIGNETIGAGVKDLYFADMNAMMFSGKFKGINYLKANNTATDLSEDLIAHNTGDYQKRIDNNKPQPLLFLPSYAPAGLSRDKYLRNNSFIFNVNNLVNLRKDEQLKINAYTTFDKENRDYSSITKIILPSQTVIYRDGQNTHLTSRAWNVNFNYLLNKDKYYLSNSFLFNKSNADNISNISSGIDFSQKLQNTRLDISNEFNLMRYTKQSNLYEIYSYFNRSSIKDQSNFEPGIYPEIFNQGVPFSYLMQSAHIPSWFTNSYFLYRIPKGKLTQSYKTGISYQNQVLLSQLSPSILSGTIDSSRNNLTWQKLKVYGEASYDWIFEKAKISLQLPVSYQQMNLTDTNYSYKPSLKRLFFNPYFLLKYYVGKESDFSLTYSMRSDIGTINEFYRGYVLSSFRNLNANDGTISQQRNQSVALGYNYKESISMFFTSVFVAFSQVHNNNIQSQLYFNNFQKNVMIPIPYNTSSWLINGRMSKYIYPLHSTLTANLSYQISTSSQFQNNILVPVNVIIPMTELNIESSLSKKISLSYNINLSRYRTVVNGNFANPLKTGQLTYKAALSYNLFDQLTLACENSFFHYNQSGSESLNYNFLDAKIKYRLFKSRLELEGTAKNILNIEHYSTRSLLELTQTSSTYELPGRMILLKANFSL
ncbi:TonB-dependent receptor [Chryseobacterium sp. G0201]|nr:TonB-dependent receptor [Chryseobacterium sp. G0201]